MRKINYIIIHHSGNTDTPKKIKKLNIEINKWNDIGYHFIISRYGKIINGRNIEINGAHV